MAANKFATMLHRNTNKITLILIYAILEWILIILLLLNSLFSYLIIKFADYFGLKRPCVWCSRIDHILEPGKNKNSYRDLVCEAHASEISKLGYCLNHQKLAELQDMCEDCSSSFQPADSPEFSKRYAFFPWMNKIGVIQSGDEIFSENGEGNLKCSCCSVSVNLNNKFYPSCILIKPSWEDFDDTQKQNLIAETDVVAQIDEGDQSDQSKSDFVTNLCEDEQSIGENRGIQIVSDVVMDGESARREEEAEGNCSVCDFGCKELVVDKDDKLNMVIGKELEPVKEESNMNLSMDDQSCDQTVVHVNLSKDTFHEIQPQHLEFYIDQEDCRLIPVELSGSATTEDQGQPIYKLEDQGYCENQDVILDFDMHIEAQAQPVVENWHSSEEMVALLSALESEEEPKVSELESMVLVETENTSILHKEVEDLVKEEFEQVSITQATQTSSHDEDEDEDEDLAREMDSDAHQASEEAIQMQSNELDVEISLGTEIPDQEPLDEAQTLEALPSYEHRQEDPSTSSVILHVDDDNGSKQAEEEFLEFKTMSIETSKQEINSHISFSLELNEIEEEKVPDTPTSVDSLHHLHKKLLLLGRESGTEESFDGSIISEIEGGELTTEKLISAFRAERKALNALYAELEEERSASAVAANQTMAMINRLQEEKAAMQMEALQYQRMMEEQSEYDQEALQLLNELMVKREKENHELEKELEIYRKKVHDYEAKERIMMSRRRESSTRSTASCSNTEDSDGISIDLNHDVKEEDSFYGNQESSSQNTPPDAVVYLEESLANFEEERLSILEQLKELEEKLFTLSEDEVQHFEDVKPVGYSFHENGNGYHKNSDSDTEVNGVDQNGHSKEMNGKHHQELRFKGSKAKRLLPLFDAIGEDCEDGLVNGHEQGFDHVALLTSLDAKFEMEKKLAIEEEVDHVYERLEVLEADREFLKHCISSLRKGDKGLDLLQEILQHLRDLRSVEVRVKKMGDGAIYSL